MPRRLIRDLGDVAVQAATVTAAATVGLLVGTQLVTSESARRLDRYPIVGPIRQGLAAAFGRIVNPS